MSYLFDERISSGRPRTCPCISEINELANVPNPIKCFQKTLVQLDSAADCIVRWMIFSTEGMVVGDGRTLVNAFHEFQDASFVWSVLH